MSESPGDAAACQINDKKTSQGRVRPAQGHSLRDAPVVSVSLGDTAVFRIGGTTRKAPTRSLRLASGDVVSFGGPARLAYHGIDRILPGTSDLVPGGGRINLTLRRVNPVEAGQA